MFADAKRLLTALGYNHSQMQMNPPSQGTNVYADNAFVDEAQPFAIHDECNDNPYYDQYRQANLCLVLDACCLKN